MNHILAFALGLGFVAGLRSLTPPAAVAWAGHFGWLNLNQSPLAFMGSTIAVVYFFNPGGCGVNHRFAASDAKANSNCAAHRPHSHGRSLWRRTLRRRKSTADQRCDSRRSRRSDRSIRRLQCPEKIGRCVQHQRHFHRLCGRRGRDRTRLCLCLTLTWPAALR